MEYYAVYFPLLIGVLIGLSVPLFFYFRDTQKRDLLKELVRTNKLHSIRFACLLRKMLREKSNAELYVQLSCLSVQYKIPDLDAAEGLEDTQVAIQGLDALDDYLSVLELCCYLVGEGALSRRESRSLLGNRLRNIREHKEVSGYVRDYAMQYKYLLGQLDLE